MKDKYSLRRVSRPFNLGRDSNPQELPIIFTLAKYLRENEESAEIMPSICEKEVLVDIFHDVESYRFNFSLKLPAFLCQAST